MSQTPLAEGPANDRRSRVAGIMSCFREQVVFEWARTAVFKDKGCPLIGGMEMVPDAVRVSVLIARDLCT